MCRHNFLQYCVFSNFWLQFLFIFDVGGNRYVPGGSVPTVAGSTDPFTGGNRYVPMDVSYPGEY